MPPGFFDDHGKVRLLKAALYGHPRSGQLWFNMLVTILKSMNFVQSNRDRCFFYTENGDYLFEFYVDDFLLGSASDELEQKFFIEFENRNIKIRKLGFPQNIAGLEIYKPPDSNYIIMHQASYVKQMAAKFGIKKSSPNPMTKFTRPIDGTVETFNFEYSSLLMLVV